MTDAASKEGEGSDGEPTIVAIGGSAGAIGALQALFEGIPADTGAAYVVIVHLDPHRTSELPAILSSRTKMHVRAVEDTVKLERNHVYVIPPDRRLEIVDHHISAAAFQQPRGARSPIDQFFRSMADHVGDGCAVIL